MPKATTTIGTILKFGTSASSLSELAKIKSFPQLGGEREQIESTDLTDNFQTFEPGVQSVESMSFSCNFVVADYLTVKQKAMTEGYFELDFGATGGKATWQGKYDCYVNEGEVNGLIEYTIVCYPSTGITIAAGGSST